jgi:hypothetical protein
LLSPNQLPFGRAKSNAACHNSDICFNVCRDFPTMNPIAHSTSISRAESFRHRARCATLLLTTSFMAVTSTACGGGGSGNFLSFGNGYLEEVLNDM